MPPLLYSELLSALVCGALFIGVPDAGTYLAIKLIGKGRSVLAAALVVILALYLRFLVAMLSPFGFSSRG